MNKGLILNIPRRFVFEEWGGTETVIAETSKSLTTMGYKTEIITTLALSNKTEDAFNNIPIKRFPYSYTRLFLSPENRQLLDKRGGNMYSLKLLLYILFCKDVKVVHLHTLGRLGALIRLVARAKGIPYVVSIHGGLLDLPKKQLDDLIAPTKRSFNWGKVFDILCPCKHLIRDADAIICVGKEEQQKIKHAYPDKKVTFLPNGVDIDKFQRGKRLKFLEHVKQFNITIAEDDLLILCVSSFYPQKNQLTLIDAFAERLAKDPRLKLVMIGVVYDQGYFDKINQRIDELGIRFQTLILTNIQFDDPVLCDAYSAADLFVLPSLYETFGVVVLEAWASNSPVICGKVGGLPSFVKDGVNGIFSDINNAASLSVSIKEVLYNKQLNTKLHQNALNAVHQYSWQSITTQLSKVYEEITV